jgi:signal transduction histidine kinase
MQISAVKDKVPLPLLAFILVTSLIVITGGFTLYNSQRNKILIEKENELVAISSLKTEEISKWRMEHIRDARIISNIVPRNKLILSFLGKNNTQDLSNELTQRMKAFIENYDYHSIIILDSQGNIKLAYPKVDTTFNASARNSILINMQHQGISFSDFNFSDDLPGLIHIDMQIPILLPDSTVAGAILMRINPEKSLFPVIQSWPTPSETSETYLVKIEDDSLLILNDLKFYRNSALKLKLPLTNNTLPGVRAVKGFTGIFEGTDYRGVRVLSYLSKVPYSPWLIVTKVDKKEVYTPLIEHILLIFTTVLLMILSVTIATIYYWKNQRIRYLKELNDLKDKFFSIVSHDLRSPFVSINGFSGLLMNEVHNLNLDKVEKYAALILNSSQNAIDLLKNLTEWARLQTNRMQFNRREIDLVPVINEVTELLSLPAMQKSIVIEKKLPPVLTIHADKEMISSILRNLVSNAIKFSNPEGRVYITASRKEEQVHVEVLDFGVGMKNELVEKLFSKKENISMPGTMGEYGTGLGLVLVKEFITLHGGSIRVESEPGKCSRFKFSLPV